VWESSLETVMHRIDVCKSTVLRSAFGWKPGEISATQPTLFGCPSHGLTTQHALTDLVGSGLGFSHPWLCSLLQLDNQLRFGDAMPCSCKTTWDFVIWFTQIFPPSIFSVRKDMFWTCAASKEAASHIGYQTLETGLVSMRSNI
jgi:hypothetical protein